MIRHSLRHPAKETRRLTSIKCLKPAFWSVYNSHKDLIKEAIVETVKEFES
jgi:hypothetical protein